jgi:hypothetical protein
LYAGTPVAHGKNMRLVSPATLALVLGSSLVAATLRTTPATAAVGAVVGEVGGEATNGDPCVQLQGDADEGRFACAADREGGRWAVRLDAPVPGAQDLTLTATHVDARGARTPFTARVPGAAAWWFTIAPVEQAVANSPDGTLAVDLTRVGFQRYPVGHFVFRAWTP